MTGDWVDELDLDPTSTWRKMGTRALGDRPWLVADDQRDEQLALKSVLLSERRDEVLATGDRSLVAASEVRELVADAGFEPASVDDPLEAAALAVQEDLCLLRRRDDAWHLDAACVCFPSRWRLRDKIDRPLVEVHAPTPGYAEHLAPRVDRLLDRVDARPVLRRNWFVHPDPALFQPTAPVPEPTVPAHRVEFDLHVRSERQTLRRLPSGWILFTIRVQQLPLGAALDTPQRRRRFAGYVAHAPAADASHRGLSPAQVAELRLADGLASDDAG